MGGVWWAIDAQYAQAATGHPPGTLVKIGTTVWRIGDDGTYKESIDSAEKFYSHRFSFVNVLPTNSVDIALRDNGIMAWGDGVLFNYNNVIYQISGGAKHGFTSADIFLKLGFTFSMAKPGNLSSIPDGTSINSGSDRHLPGTLLKDSSGTIWQQTSEGKAAFPSVAVFFSHGGVFSEVVTINNADLTSVKQQAPLTYRMGSLINDNGTIWSAQPPNKTGFPSAACYLGFGFTFGMAIPGSTTSLNPNNYICGESVVVPPTGQASSYSEQSVTTSDGNFTARIASFNLFSGKIRVLTDTAADGDCSNDCAVASLKAFAAANNAQSGIHGTYFCPADYADCAGKTNTFFWKVIDSKLGIVVNKNNGLGEQDPFLAFDAGGNAKYFSTWNDYAKSNYSAVAGMNSYALIENNAISLNYSKLDEKQKTTKSIRGAVGVKGSTLYLVHVLNATVPDVTLVLRSLALDNAIGLDGGGSSALLYQGTYKTSPGRLIPNAILVQELP